MIEIQIKRRVQRAVITTRVKLDADQFSALSRGEEITVGNYAVKVTPSSKDIK